MRQPSRSQLFISRFFLRLVPSALALISTLALILFAGAATATAGTETILHSFSSWPHGNQPDGSLIADASGNLYGVTAYGGAYGAGTVYELTPNSHGGWTEILLYSFGDTSGGNSKLGSVTGPSSPVGSLLFDHAGNLYGATTGGGPDQAGTIFELIPHPNGRWTQKVLWNFHFTDGANPNGGLVFDAAGNLYGTTFYGGGVGRRDCINGGCGTVFRLSPQTHGPWSLTTLYRFQGSSDGSLPNATLVFDASGHIFGSTREGGDIQGNLGSGVVFELAPGKDGWVETVVHAFTGEDDGFNPSNLIADNNGNLYGEADGGSGTACFGGSCGLVFKFSPHSGEWNKTILFNFNYVDGDGPSGGLVFDQKGNLYGTTEAGGSIGAGTVFKLTPSGGGTWSEQVLWNFTAGLDGSEPFKAVTLGPAGHIYGTTTYNGGTAGNGTAFELLPNGSGQYKEVTMSNFADGSGDSPTTPIVFDSAGNIYGTTSRGGQYGFGSVYELIAAGNGSWTENILYNFTQGSVYNGEGFGTNPSGLIFDSAGNLYGETEFGGSAGYGTVFELSPSGQNWIYKDIYDFAGGSDGNGPQGGLVFDAAGNLYGTTETGGTGAGCHRAACGTVFELTQSNGHWSKTTLYNFAGGSTDGQNPVTKLIFDPSGNLYGTTLGGGIMGGNNCGIGCGSVFELSPTAHGWQETGIYFFTEKHGDGAIPNGGLVLDTAGNLYGTTSTGGLQDEDCGIGCGVAFKISPLSGGGLSESIIYTFTEPQPVAGLVIDDAGDLYGTTNSFSASIVFELSPTSGEWTETTLYTFSNQNGLYPEASLILDSSRNLYGTTAGGGTADGGTVFEITP